MKCASILSLAVLLTGTCAFSQEPVTGTTANLVLATPPLRMDRTNCPVGLQVKHGPGLPMSRNAGPTINGKPLNPQAQIPDQNQGIHLTLINFMPRSIVSAQIVVHGFSNKWRYVPLSAADPDLARTVEVALDVKGNGEASRDLSLSHFTAITAVAVNAITYGDGSTWRTSSPGACSVSPDLFMLVNAER